MCRGLVRPIWLAVYFNGLRKGGNAWRLLLLSSWLSGATSRPRALLSAIRPGHVRCNPGLWPCAQRTCQYEGWRPHWHGALRNCRLPSLQIRRFLKWRHAGQHNGEFWLSGTRAHLGIDAFVPWRWFRCRTWPTHQWYVLLIRLAFLSLPLFVLLFVSNWLVCPGYVLGNVVSNKPRCELRVLQIAALRKHRLRKKQQDWILQ